MRAWTTVPKDAQFSLKKKNGWMENSWKICSKRCAMFLQKYIYMYGQFAQRMNGKFVPTHVWKICPKAFMENLFQRMHEKFVPKNANIETHLWKILF